MKAAYDRRARLALVFKNTCISGVDSYAPLLRRCRVLEEGKQLHLELAKHGYDRDRNGGNLLVQMYGNCGSVEDGRCLFDKMRRKNVFSWNLMVSAYAQNGYMDDAASLFEKMPRWDVVSWTTMLAAFSKMGCIQEAESLFWRMPDRNVVSWNAMITAYAQNGHPKQALELFRNMAMEGVQADDYTFTGVLEVCSRLGAIQVGESLHEKIEETGSRSNPAVECALVNMFGKCGRVEQARKVFETMTQHTITACTAMLAAYAQNGHMAEAKAMFDNLASPDGVAWNVMLGAYAHNGYLEEARKLFDGMPDKCVISLNAMISAYAQSGHNKDAVEALKLFVEMDLEGVPFNEATLVSALDACTSAMLIREGKAIQELAVSEAPKLSVQTAILSFHAKCGGLEDARRIFDRMLRRDEIAWNAMLSAYARNGASAACHEMFEVMQLEGFRPNESTLVIVLSACSHGGMLSTGLGYFRSISYDYGAKPSLDHFMCMIDLLGRAGQLARAEELIKSMPYVPAAAAWTAFLGACRTQGDDARGELAADASDSAEATNYVLLCNAKLLKSRCE